MTSKKEKCYYTLNCNTEPLKHWVWFYNEQLLKQTKKSLKRWWGKMIGINYIFSEYNLKAINLILPIWLEKLYLLLSLWPSPMSATGFTVQELFLVMLQTLSLLGWVIARSWTDSAEQMYNLWQGLWSQGCAYGMKTRTKSIVSPPVSQVSHDVGMQLKFIWSLSQCN